MTDSPTKLHGRDHRERQHAGPGRDRFTAHKWFRVTGFALIAFWCLACIIATILLLG